MNILTKWLRHYLPNLPVTDRQLADDLTLRGIAVEGVHDLGSNNGTPNGSLFEMDITTNRVDAMNHYGIAREAATIYNLPLSPLGLTTESSSRAQSRDPRISPEAAQTFPVTIEAPALCGRFTAQVLRNVTIAPSTGQIAEYFNLLGQKQISNAVDASNFVLLGMGHPTHAFDLDKLEGGLIVRLARKGERLKLLDGTDRTLEPDDLVIADQKKALGLAGVMGGWDTMITPETKNILIEAAWFDPVSIRRSSRRHGLHTDASHRFERGADFNAAPVANALVSHLILQHGGHAEGELIDVIIPQIAAHTASRPPIQLSVSQVQRHLGTTLDDTPTHSALTPDLIHQYLTALGCTLTTTDKVSLGLAGGFSPLNSDPRKGASAPGLPQHPTLPSPSNSPPGVSTSSARSTSSKRSPASTATTASPTPSPHPSPSSRTQQPQKKPPSAPASSPSATANPSPAPSPANRTLTSSTHPQIRVPHPSRPLRRVGYRAERDRLPARSHEPSPWKTLSLKRPLSCAPPSSPAWSLCSATTSTAT